MTIITTRRADVHIRWLINADMPEVMEIENMSFPYCWSREDFRNSLRQRNTIGMVAEMAEKVVGFAVYELHLNRIELMNIAVHPERRRQGIGSAMVAKIISKLSAKRRNLFRVATNEQNTGSHLFFKACGLRATAIIPEYWEGHDFAAYLFEFHFKEPKKCNSSTT